MPREIRDLIRDMSRANPYRGSPRIKSELAKIGIELSESTVAKYMDRHRKPPSATWRAFLANHMQDLVALDFFVVPTATFRILFVFLIMSHDRRRVIHFNVTSSPSALWAGQQMIEAFPWDTAPRYILRDRDGIYGKEFRKRVYSMGIKEVIISRQAPWQNPYVERLVGSIRRECLDHVIVLDEKHLLRILTSYFGYYHRARCHLSLDRDAPVPRQVHPPEMGKVVAIPQVGGLHHLYVRQSS